MDNKSLKTLPEDATKMMDWSWTDVEPYYKELAKRILSAANVNDFLNDWTRLHDRLDEVFNRLYVAKDVNTADKDAEQRYVKFLDEIFPKTKESEQKLKTKLLDSGLKPKDFDLPLRKMQTEAAIYRQENLPLLVEQQKLGTGYNKIIGSQTVQWEGEETTVTQLRAVYQSTDRTKREQAWRLAAERQLADRSAINELWTKFLNLRLQLAQNAGFKDYGSYRWQDMLRFDYTPDNCKQFHKAIEGVVVPAAFRIYERRRKDLGVKTLRPWDLDADPLGRPALKPFSEVSEFKSKVATILYNVNRQIGEYFQTMIDENLLDLDNRKNKAPGGYCTSFEAAKRPFIFMNAVGLHQDVITLVHESGHACHSFEASKLPYYQQRQVGFEFAEVASMGMELLSSPYISKEEGGFYTEADTARARKRHLEDIVLFLPYMAVVDAFQHWVYENPNESTNPNNCDQQWMKLWNRFTPGVDWSGFDDALVTGWHRKLHIHQEPFYYVEYGLAQLGALQVWINAMKDQKKAVVDYLRALALGGMNSLPELYAAAGAKFAFDAQTLRPIVTIIEQKIESLDSKE
jgi:oligoendopeptidase F